MRYQVNPGDIHNAELEQWCKFAAALTREQKHFYITNPPVEASDEVRTFLLLSAWSTAGRATCGRKVQKDENNNPILNADGTKAVVNPDLFEQYTNADEYPIIVGPFTPRYYGEFIAEGPAALFDHLIIYRSVGKIAVEGSEYDAFATTVVRRSKGDDGITVMDGIALITGPGKMVEITLRSDGRAKDLAEGFIDVRILKHAIEAVSHNNQNIERALQYSGVSPQRSEQLVSVRKNNDHALAALRA